MATQSIIEIDVDRLLLDLENPRREILQGQDAAVQRMLDDQGDKLVNLARDIVEMGVNPSELPIVMPLAEDPSRYVVLEGNRRVAAIMLLLNPKLAAKGRDASVRKEFEELSRAFQGNHFDRLNCVLIEQREDSDHWIKLRHTGENKGVGVVGWEAEAVTRFNERLGRSDFNSRAMQVMQYLRETTMLDESTKANLDRVPLTNLARLVNDPDVRRHLGLQLRNSEIETDLPESEVLKGLTRIVDDLASGHISVKDIYYKANRRGYLETFRPQDSPDMTTATGQTWKLTSGSSSERQVVTREAGKTKRREPLSTSRKTLIPTGVQLQIRHYRLNQIYHELRRLEADRFPNCAAVMLRVFLELSVDQYSSDKKVPDCSVDSPLRKKLMAVADFMKNGGVLNDHQLKAVRVASSSQHTLLSIETLHAYVHNKDLVPKPSELKTTWDNLQLFIEKLWE